MDVIIQTRKSFPRQRRWPGVVFSLLVPGFGLLRAGKSKRALLWFLLIPITTLIAAALLVSEQIPLIIGVVVLVVSTILYLVMLWDSFREGEMKMSLWYLFFGILLLSYFTPFAIPMILGAFVVPTGSMAPTLRGADSPLGSDFVLVDRLSYRFEDPQRGDLLVFSTAEISELNKFRADSEKEEFFIFRVVGLPGETITIEDGEVLADGLALGREQGIPPSVFYLAASEVSTMGEEGEANIKVGEGEYFVLGDNSRTAWDSRFWGGVPRSSVYGKATKIYYPFSRAGRISLDAEK